MTPFRRSIAAVATVAALGGSIVAIAATPAAAATTLTVSTTSDTNPTSGPCATGTTTPPSPLSLRDAVCVANNDGGTVEIDVPSGHYVLSNGELDLETKAGQNVTVKGDSQTGVIIDGNGASRVFDLDENIVGGISTTLEDLTVTNGLDNTYGGAGIIAGSGNAATADNLTLTDVTVSDNQANTTPTAEVMTDNPGGGLQFIGGALSITDSTFSNNSDGSSNGSALAYEAIGTTGQSFSMTGSTITGNTGDNKAVPPAKGFFYTDGAVSVGAASASVAMSISTSTFTGNQVAQSTGPGRGGAVTLEGGALSVTESSFTSNALSGANTVGGAIAVASGTLAANDDRIVGNTAASGSGIGLLGGTANATDDWWGCNAGPGSAGCDAVTSGATTAPRLNLAGAAVTLDTSGTATVTATLKQDNTGTAVTGSQPEFNGVGVTFGTPTPAGTTCTGATTSFSGGTASATCTLNGNGTEGLGSIPVTVDGFTISIPITVTKKPTVTTNPSDVTVQPTQTATFTVAADGYPTPTVQWQVSTDGGTTFSNVPTATSTTLSFTASAGDNGNLYRAVFTNSSGSATTNTAKLTVEQAPSFTSSSTADFTLGAPGEFDITTSGVPQVVLISPVSGSLPSGLTFTDNGDGTAKITGTPAAGTAGSYSLTLDASNGIAPDATQQITVNVDTSPTITSDGAATFPVGTDSTFTVTTGGFPAPSLTESGALPGGVTFTDNGDGTATLTGTPLTGSAGTYQLTIKASSTGGNFTQGFTLDVTGPPSISSADSTTFTAGTAGTFTVTTTAGYPAGASLSETGALPTGVTFADNGDGTATLAGTPTTGTGGTYPITITASNGETPDATQAFTLTVDEAPSFTTADHATFQVGQLSTFTATVDPGYPAGFESVGVSGAPPTGVTASPDATTGTVVITGTPAAGTAGEYLFGLEATNTAGLMTNQVFTLTVTEAPAISSADATTFTAGTAGSFTVTTTGSPTPALSESGTLPDGVTFLDNGDGTATLAGTPATGTGGTYSITITASNGETPDATQSFTLTIDEAPSYTTADHTTFQVGQKSTFTATIDPGYPASFAIVGEDGTPPSGVSVTPDVGNGTVTFTGTPDAGTAGSYSFTLEATNTAGLETNQIFTLTITEAPAISSADATTFTAGTAGSFTVTTTGSPTPALSESGALPSGVTFVDNGDGTATLAGTPAADTGGTYPITITATNGATPDATQSFTLTVDEAPSITSADATSFAGGQAGTFTVSTQGFPAAGLSESGSLPSGVTFADNGDGTATISGTPGNGAAGTYPISITASNGISPDATQAFTLTVTTLPQAITFTSTPPANPVVGETYPVTATGGGSGNAVALSIDPTATSVCSISSGTVTFDHPGSCVIDANQDGDAQYAAGTGSQTVAVGQAATTTTVKVTPTTIVATVSVTAPGAGSPTGTVTFSVDGTTVGTAPVSGGVATLSYAVPTGKSRSVAAVYGGDADFTGSSGSTARHDPTITATVKSAQKRTKYGWYRSAVTVTFHCTTNGAALTAACPKPVTLRHNGAGMSVTRTILATDGGAATVAVRGINIDKTKPKVRIRGVRSGAVYPGKAPKARCVAKDALSGVASCRLTKHTHRGVVTLKAIAKDKAGNVRRTSVHYQLTRFYVLGEKLRHGAYRLREGHDYTFVALIRGTTPPRYYDAAPYGQTPRPATAAFARAGRQYGLHRFTVVVHLETGFGRYKYWVSGIKAGSTMHLIKFHATPAK